MSDRTNPREVPSEKVPADIDVHLRFVFIQFRRKKGGERWSGENPLMGPSWVNL